MERIEREFAGRKLIIETGRMAKQAHGACLVQYGETVALCTVTAQDRPTHLPFFPLTVEYREKTYAAGKIPGGFLKREGRPSDKEILAVARELVNADDLRGHDLSSPALVKEFLRLRLNVALEYEVFGLILLDGQNRLVEYLEPFRGTVNQSAVYPREVVKLALAKNAQSVMLVHNHPSGAREASRADIALTKHLKDALALVDVRVLDHFIVAGATVVSMAEAGLL